MTSAPIKTVNVLVIYYSQTGQLEQIIDSIIRPLELEQTLSVDKLIIKPSPDFPFPWSSTAFFEQFPESVMGIPCPLAENKLPDKEYDLIILGYQPWYLSVSRPIMSFLQLPATRKLFQDKKVITVIGCRNMWTQAQEMMKKQLISLNARLVGNIVLRDRAYNLVSVYTVLRWMLYGKKGASGVSGKDIDHASLYGEYIKNSLLGNQPIEQNELVTLGAVEAVNGLILLEKRAIVIFRLFAAYVLKKGPYGSKLRAKRLLLFRIYLMVGIIILSPIAFILGQLRGLLARKQVAKEKKYFEGV